MKKIYAIALFGILSASLLGCAPASPPATFTPAPTDTALPTVTPLPTHTQTPLPTDTPTVTPPPAILIETSEGALEVIKVEVVNTFPPGCAPIGFGCSQAAPGYVILVVWLEKADEGMSIDSSELINKPIYVTSSDGLKTKIFAGGIYNGGLFVAFTPPESAHDFVLEWPDAPPVELGQ